MQVLIIFDRFGESDLELYLIPDAPAWLLDVHNTFVNGTCERPETLRVYDAVYDAVCAAGYTNPDDEICGTWSRFKIDLDADTLTCSDCRVVRTGVVP